VAFASAKDLHLARFITSISRKVRFPGLPLPVLPQDLPVADVAAFSIDDVTTTEIDDAFS
jgi:exoribonuclease-2